MKIGPVLKRWVEMMLEPWDGNKDAPWWYNERASLSQFAGAVWLKGGWVFEEYSASKKRGGPLRAKRPGQAKRRYAGRVDLMFDWRTVQVVAEAKQIWPSLDARATFRVQIDRCLRVARDEAARAPDVAGRYRRAGIVFIVPVVPPRLARDAQKYSAALHGLISELRGSSDASVAWAFPADRRRLRSKVTKYTYPGIAVAIGEVV